MSRNPIDHRSPALIVEILGLLEDVAPDPIPAHELLRELTSDAIPKKTIESTIYDLRRFGAIYRAEAIRGKRAPSFRVTDLGIAWLEGIALRRPGRDEGDRTVDEVVAAGEQALEVLFEIMPPDHDRARVAAARLAVALNPEEPLGET